MPLSDDVICISAQAKKNSLTSFVVAGLFAVLAMLLFLVLPASLYLVGFFMLSAALVAGLIGWFKVREPEHSMLLDKQRLTYRHRNGQWQLAWDNVQRIDVPKVQSGLSQLPITFVGIKIKDYAPLLEHMSLRLMTNLLMEQRPLLLQNRDENCATGACGGGDLIEDDKFTLPSGKKLKGIQAMMANRMDKLRQQLGYDLYIATAELDRPADEFASLLNDCLNRVSEEHSATV